MSSGAKPPKKPRKAVDHFVLEAFKAVDKEDVVDLGELSESTLRKVCQLVSDETDFDEGLDFKELKAKARQLLQVEGNNLRFLKSIAQIKAKARWQEMSAKEKEPYEAKRQAEEVRWKEWHEAEAAKKAGSAGGGGSGSSPGAADAGAKKEKKEKPQAAASTSDGGGKGGDGDASTSPGGGGVNNLLLSKKERKDKAAAEASSKKAKKEKRAEEEAENRALPGKKRKRFADDDDSSADEGGGKGGGAGKGSVVVDQAPCPELGEGWVCISKKRLGGQGSKQVDKTYVSPDGKQFNSRKKVLQYLGLESDPLEPNAKPPKPPRAFTHKERQKQRLGEAKARLQACLTRSQRTHERLVQLEAGYDASLPFIKGSSPEPPGRLPLTDGSIAADLMPIWAFVTSFSHVLTLQPFSVDDFCAHLQRQERSVLLAEVHVRLLRSLLSNIHELRDKHQGPVPAPGTEVSVPLLLQQLPPAACVTPTSWPEVLRTACYLMPMLKPDVSSPHDAPLCTALEALSTEAYEDLSPVQKLALLRPLVQAVLDLGEAGPANDRRPIHELVGKDHVERQTRFAQERREAETNAKRDANATISLIEQRKLKRIAEATMTVPSDVAAAHLAAKEEANALMLSGRGGGPPKGAAAAAAAAAAELAAKEPVPTVPFAPAPIEVEVSDSGDEEEEAADQAAMAANGGVNPDPEASSKRAAREQRRRRKEASEALMAAIESREVRALEKALDLAERAGHEGEHPGKPGTSEKPKPWRTDVFKAAIKIYAEAVAHDEKVACRKKELRKMKAILNQYLGNWATLPVKDEPLGVDRRGRLHWWFLHQPNRVFVSQPTPVTGPFGSGGGSGGSSSSGGGGGGSGGGSSGSGGGGGSSGTWSWAYYDTLSSVRELYQSLDPNGTEDEKKLKSGLRERLPLFEDEMAEEVEVNKEEGWLEEGHEYMGELVIQVGDGWVSHGKVTRWLPATEAKLDAESGEVLVPREPALFHIVHEDGDEEDLDELEAAEARKRYLDKEATGGDVYDYTAAVAKNAASKSLEYSNKLERRVAARLTHLSLGVHGLRDELLAFEEQLSVGLARYGSSWTAPHGNRASWLLSCRDSTSVVELAQLLASLETAVHELQTAPEGRERPPWRTEGHPYIGRRARRFFPSFGASDGRIVGYLPAENDDPAYWHMEHGDDDDEEDLDEQEALFAMANYDENRSEMTEEERLYLAKFEEEAQAEAQAKQAKATGGESGAGGADDDDDMDDDVEEADDPKDDDTYLPPEGDWRVGATRSGTTRGGGGRAYEAAGGGGGVGKMGNKRLWLSSECRERWLQNLRGTPSLALVSLAAVALKQHCRALGVLVEPKGAHKMTAADMEVETHSWCHAAAFGTKNPKKLASTAIKKKKKGR